jgi:isopentenyldiphosphate isomerase
MTKRKAIKWWKDELGMATKAKVEDHIRTIVDKYPNGAAINHSDQNFLDSVLRHHYQYTAKIGCGIRHLEVRSNPSWNGATRGLWIVRTDGSEIDISWVVALKPDGRPDVKEDVSKAARYEVYRQIHHHHEHGECDLCPICSLPMERGVNVHVDHAEPFSILLDKFLKAKGLSYDQIAIEDLGLNSQFSDRELGQEWHDHHAQHATLRLTHAVCNLARKAA